MRTTIGVFILMVATALAHDSGRKDSYVFRDVDVTWMLGEGMSSDSLKKMQSTLGREFLWARRKGRTFVSHDSGIIDQARAVVQRNIGRDEQEARLAEITDRAMRRSYVLATDGGVSFSSGVDFKNIKYLRKQYNDSFLWVRTDGHSWLIQDPEWIDRATVFFADAMALAPEQRAVANGLQVYSVEDHTAPTVAIQVWYHVGSKDDPPGRSGFAHLFEHMMFKSTAHMKSEMMDRLTEDVGGYNNASTADDVTWYYEEVPSNYLQTLLWAEADRMGSLSVDEANFNSEREVVKEEFRTSVLGNPYGLFYYDITKDSFTTHPYRRPTIGSIEDLDASTLADVQKFHAAYYRPDNATLVIVGDFDSKQLDAWVDQYFAAVGKPDLAIPRVEVKEPAREASKKITENGPNVPLPAVALTWLAPSATHPDRYALDIASAILSQGESSRLYQSLIYRQQIAQDVSADDDLREDLGIYVITATVASGKSPNVVLKAIDSELRDIEQKPVSAAEIAKAKNQLITEVLRRRETNDGKAFAIGHGATVLHDAAEVNNGLAKLQAVTAADVQRVVNKYLKDGKSLIITYVSKGAAQ